MAEAERIALSTYGLAVSASPLSGERDSNFRLRTADGRDFVLKIFDAASEPAAIDCQVSVLRHVAEQDPGLPVPRLYPTLEGADIGRASRDGGECSTALLTFMPGRPFTAGCVNDALLNDLGVTLARMDRCLRGFFHPALAQVLAWDVRRLPELVEFSSHLPSVALRRCVESVAGVLKQRLMQLRGLRSQALHGAGRRGAHRRGQRHHIAMGENRRHSLALPFPFRTIGIEQAFADRGPQHAAHDFRFGIIGEIVQHHPFHARRIGHHVPADQHVAGDDGLAIGQAGNDLQHIAPGDEGGFDAAKTPPVNRRAYGNEGVAGGSGVRILKAIHGQREFPLAP